MTSGKRWHFTTRRKLGIGAAALVAGGGLWVFLDGLASDEANVAAAQSLRREIEKRGQFGIVSSDLQARIAPLVTTPERKVVLTDLARRNEAEALRSLGAALDVYPTGFVNRFLDKVAMAERILFWDVATPIGGFFFPRGICISYGGDWSDAFWAIVTDAFHHELSSLVRAAAPFDEARWIAFNPPGFTYLDEAQYRQMIRSTSHDIGDAALLEAGFVRPYGRSDVDDDWNTYAEQVFGHAASFAALIKPYPRMRGKTAMMLDTYQSLDSRFADYFESTGLRAAVATGGNAKG